MIGLPSGIRLKLIAAFVLLPLASCSTSLPDRSDDNRHIQAPQVIATDDIPDIVRPMPLLPQPQAQAAPELFTVVVQDVPVRQLLFAMARDAGINIDVHPNVSGEVSINAVDQTLPQIIERIGRQVDFRWRIESDNTLIVEPDTPFQRTYRVDYVNVTRDAATGLNVSNSIGTVAGAAGGGGAGSANNSTATLSQSSSNNFWVTLVDNIRGLLGETSGGGAAAGGAGGATGGAGGTTASAVVANAESGLIIVNATSRQHDDIAAFIDNVRSRSLAQVMIEATVVEVSLSDNYQSGVDWATISRNSGQIDFLQSVTGINLTDEPASVMTIDRTSGPDAIAATIRMLSEFGDLRVLSSPKIMALNNQAAMLRVVDNRVYFTIEVEPGIAATANSAATPATYTSEVHTVPVGFVMSVTPQISDSDQVTLNVRPTISRIVRFVNDPNPVLAETGVINAIPEIQIREIESILKVYSGQVAVLGGLMQDTLDNNTSGLPIASRLPGIRNLFSYRNDTATKTELIVFIRPVVVRQPSIDGDLQQFREFLPVGGTGVSDFFSNQPVQQTARRPR
ncbi:MAG: type II and III secretion system protein [Pseudohongiella sp.]|nr:type II and III secretion system protein [Pseudohongiella sp.]